MFFEVRVILENGIFLFAKPPKERRGFEKIKVECLCLVLRGRRLLGFDSSAEFPDEGGEFTGNRNFDFVVMDLSFFEHFEAMAEAGLGSPGEFFDPEFRAFLSFRKLGTDFGRDPVVSCLFDEDPAGMGISAFANSALSFAGSTGVFGGDEAEEGHEFLGVFKTTEGSDF